LTSSKRSTRAGVLDHRSDLVEVFVAEHQRGGGRPSGDLLGAEAIGE